MAMTNIAQRPTCLCSFTKMTISHHYCNLRHDRGTTCRIASRTNGFGSSSVVLCRTIDKNMMFKQRVNRYLVARHGEDGYSSDCVTILQAPLSLDFSFHL